MRLEDPKYHRQCHELALWSVVTYYDETRNLSHAHELKHNSYSIRPIRKTPKAGRPRSISSSNVSCVVICGVNRRSYKINASPFDLGVELTTPPLRTCFLLSVMWGGGFMHSSRVTVRVSVSKVRLLKMIIVSVSCRTIWQC